MITTVIMDPLICYNFLLLHG